MADKCPVKAVRIFNSESKTTYSKQMKNQKINDTPITSLEDLLYFQTKQTKIPLSKGEVISCSTLESNKCLSRSQLLHSSNIEMIEKREIWPEVIKTDKHTIRQKYLGSQILTKSQSNLQLPFIRMNIYSQSKSEEKYPLTKKSAKLCQQSKPTLGYIPMYNTKIQIPSYHILTNYSNSKQISKKPSHRITLQRPTFQDRQLKSTAQIGIGTDLTIVQLNAMQKQYQSKRRQKHSVTPQIDFANDEKKVCPNVLNKRLQKVLKKYQ